MSPAPAAHVDLQAFERLLGAHGATDAAYLRRHWPRFVATKAMNAATWRCPGGRVLDLGAHWLHLSLLYALDGCRVTAVDLPPTVALPAVAALARAHDIRVVGVADLAVDAPLAALPGDAFDLVLVSEVLEHLAFNPVALWRDVHRVLATGGRIVVTTPNVYALTGRHLRRPRAWLGGGGGAGIDEILDTPTHGHHWKEYSRGELLRYFARLSPDFVVRRAVYVDDAPLDAGPPARRLARAVRSVVPPLRGRLHVEVDLPRKARGVVVEPRWDD